MNSSKFFHMHLISGRSLGARLLVCVFNYDHSAVVCVCACPRIFSLVEVMNKHISTLYSYSKNMEKRRPGNRLRRQPFSTAWACVNLRSCSLGDL